MYLKKIESKVLGASLSWSFSRISTVFTGFYAIILFKFCLLKQKMQSLYTMCSQFFTIYIHLNKTQELKQKLEVPKHIQACN